MISNMPHSDRRPPNWGGPLTEADYEALAKSWITRDIADVALLRRVDDHEGAEVIGQPRRKNAAGILIGYYWPGESSPVNYRLRRDNPELTQGKDGKLKEKDKYLSAPGASNRLYIPPGVTPPQLSDATLSIIIVEGEKKALALWRLANHGLDRPRFLPIGIAGVWSWLGTRGKVYNAIGDRVDEKGALPDFDRINWTERLVKIAFDTNVHHNSSVQAARNAFARFLQTTTAKPQFVTLPKDCGVNGIDDLLNLWGPDKVLELLKDAIDAGRMRIVDPPQFEVTSDGIFRITIHGEDSKRTQLTNFGAWITADVARDDGLDEQREYQIRVVQGERSSQFRVADPEFAFMNWPTAQFGPTAVVLPGQKDNARAAIQLASKHIEERRVYAHTGWRNLGGQDVFLFAGGAIGRDGLVPGISVELAGPLSRYELRVRRNEDLAKAVRASLRLLYLASPRIGFALLGATIRAVLGGADFSIHVAGQTGVFKSELAALFQQHFGVAMDSRNLPASWASTANFVEQIAFIAKDTLLVVDDFAPAGSVNDVSRYHAAAERVFRSAGNRAGRGRLNADAALREVKPPRALILSTGEDIPKGHSIRARMLVLELERGAIDKEALSACQRDARSGLYVAGMSGFIMWMAARYNEVLARFRPRSFELRQILQIGSPHARTPDIIASLQAAFEIYLDFAVECGAIGAPERSRFSEECQNALLDSSSSQSQYQAASDPVATYLELLRSGLDLGRAHLRPRRGTPTVVSHGECLGWEDGDHIYISPRASYQFVQLACRDSGEAFPITLQILGRRLKERGLLARAEKARGTTTTRRCIGGRLMEIWHFDRSTILPEWTADSEVDSQEADGVA